MEKKKVDPSNCFLRVERQTLHRLEKSGAVVFGFHTLFEPLSDLKAEGNGPVLAEALGGLEAGSVPAMHVYKSGVVWKDPLQDYLRS